jgi:hypothetical protein
MAPLWSTIKKAGGFVPVDDNPTLATPIEWQELRDFTATDPRRCEPFASTKHNEDG